MNISFRVGILLLAGAAGIVPVTFAQEKPDNDHTLQAMRDEMSRAKARLELKFPGTDEPVRPYYLEYRLLDLDVREVVGQFGALMSSTHTRNRFMNVQARAGNFRSAASVSGNSGIEGHVLPGVRDRIFTDQ